MLGTYLVAALTHMLRQAAPGEPWTHVICLLGADRLGGDVLDRLADACETSRTGLVLAFRSIPAGVRERLGRGNAAVAFMRLGNGDDARAASELIGTEHRFVVSQITDTVGTSLTDTWGDSYTSTVGTADSVAGSLSVGRNAGGSRGRGRSQGGSRAVRRLQLVLEPGLELLGQRVGLGVADRGHQLGHLVGHQPVQGARRRTPRSAGPPSGPGSSWSRRTSSSGCRQAR